MRYVGPCVSFVYARWVDLVVMGPLFRFNIYLLLVLETLSPPKVSAMRFSRSFILVGVVAEDVIVSRMCLYVMYSSFCSWSCRVSSLLASVLVAYIVSWRLFVDGAYSSLYHVSFSPFSDNLRIQCLLFPPSPFWKFSVLARLGRFCHDLLDYYPHVCFVVFVCFLPILFFSSASGPFGRLPCNVQRFCLRGF